jgi:hypothetical protein
MFRSGTLPEPRNPGTSRRAFRGGKLHAVPEWGSVGWVLLRCTTRLLELLGDPVTERWPASPDDWYANVFWVERRKCLLVSHAGTLFSVFAPAVRAADLRPLGAFVAPLIAHRLAREGLPAAALGPLDSAEATIARTADRQVLGCMNDLALACRHAAADAGRLTRLDLEALHYRLQRNITSARDYVPPIDMLADRCQRRPT